jgi:hypothetical protein
MKHCCKEPGELFNKAQNFGRRVEDQVKKVVIFPPDRTVEPYIAHKSEAGSYPSFTQLSSGTQRLYLSEVSAPGSNPDRISIDGHGEFFATEGEDFEFIDSN